MSNWGFESLLEWSKLLKLDNFSYLHAKKWKFGNDPWCVLTPISQLLLGQNSKSRTVLKSSGRADFKTDLPFWIWWRFDGDIDKKQTYNFFRGHGVYLEFWEQQLAEVIVSINHVVIIYSISRLLDKPRQ